jgi:hypothetical protein
MADKNPHEQALDVEVHKAEQEVARANAAPAGAGRIANINRADLALIKAQQNLDHCLSGQAGAPIKVQR